MVTEIESGESKGYQVLAKTFKKTGEDVLGGAIASVVIPTLGAMPSDVQMMVLKNDSYARTGAIVSGIVEAVAGGILFYTPYGIPMLVDGLIRTVVNIHPDNHIEKSDIENSRHRESTHIGSFFLEVPYQIVKPVAKAVYNCVLDRYNESKEELAKNIHVYKKIEVAQK